MDDLELVKEDNELQLPNPPEGVTPRPTLPIAFHPLQSNAIEDVMQIYNVLFGDVHYCTLSNKEDEAPEIICPEFSLKQLGMAVAEVQRGSAKRSKCIPPLLAHLFTMLLRKLLSVEGEAESDSDKPSDREFDDKGSGEDVITKRKADFESLADALTPSSCGEIARLYMELMDRISIEHYPTGYLQQEENNPDSKIGNVEPPSPYYGYLGPRSGTLHKAVKKLASIDIWGLDAEEISCMLKTLCDDILSRKGSVAENISKR